MNKKTKIIATIGPASESVEILRQLIDKGVNLFRFNLKHNNFEWHKKTINKAKEVAKALNKKVGIIVDFQGPEIRVETKNGEDLEIKGGESFFIATHFIEEQKTITVTPPSVIKQIKNNEIIFIDSGELELRVINKKGNVLEVKTERDGIIKNRKSMNIPSANLDLPLLADKDMEALIKIGEMEIDYIALSFVRNKEDIEILKKLLLKINPKIKIIAKIENASAIKNLEEIVSIADGVMVARGDLGIEVPIRELAFWQKKIIDLCRNKNKPVIVATQMLKSMVNSLRPTRAEATDVSNAIFDGVDALMLSEETAIGNYPVRVVEEMVNIAIFCENNGNIREVKIETRNPTEVLVEAAVRIIKDSKNVPIKTVIIFTESGNTARIFSKYRLNMPILAISDKKETVEELALSYGVNPYYKKFQENNFKISKKLIEELTGFDFIKSGDNLLLIHGNNWMESGSTSDISLITV
ncbi:MAG: pyruvate kinase [Candidatus Shapirobacteria bacterium]|nr:pyruvate kinase [Candidatus Shapirobacteria bacterium]